MDQPVIDCMYVLTYLVCIYIAYTDDVYIYYLFMHNYKCVMTLDTQRVNNGT